MRIKKSIVFWLVTGIFLISVTVRSFFFQEIFVPKDFTDARQNGVNVAQTITRLSTDSLIDLSRIAQLDREKKTGQALELVKKALENNRLAREEAIRLSAYLQVMSKNLSDISPWRARDMATEALTYQITLISHLITYNDFLNQLFQFLEDKFVNKQEDGETQIAFLINKINDQVDSITLLNRKFNDTMLDFDRITSDN